MSVNLVEESGKLIISTNHYRIELVKDKPLYAAVYVKEAFLGRLMLLSTVHKAEDLDSFIGQGNLKVGKTGKGVTIDIPVESSVWEEKVVKILCDEEAIRYSLAMKGSGKLDKIEYFSSLPKEYKELYVQSSMVHNFPGTYRRPYKDYLLSSVPGFKRIFNPQPNGIDKQFFQQYETCFITMLGDHSYMGSNFYFAPTPFCYGIDLEKEWVWVGVAAALGQNNFSTFRYEGGEQFCFSLDYQGCFEVSGEWTTPEIVFGFGARDKYEAIACHVAWLENNDFIEKISGNRPEWWSDPLFCGWGDQTFLARHYGKDDDFPGIYATQSNYNTFVNRLADKKVPFRTIIIDWQWTIHPMDPYPDEGKWPDMRAFVDEQHKAGRKVLFHIRTWLKDGIPQDECILSAMGDVLTVDPTNPVFAAKLRKRIHYLLSPQGLNGDGIKTDGNWRGPKGTGLRVHGNLGGLELQKQLFSVLYEAVKSAKQDALMTACVTHPYMRGTFDMVRLNDIFTDRPEAVIPKMKHRAKIAALSNPGLLIDCDNWTFPDKKTFLDYMELQPSIGVPSLYYSLGLEKTGELFTAADFEFLRKIWK